VRDVGSTTLRVVGWGFWSVEVAASFFPTVRDACQEVPAANRDLILDLRGLKPMRDEGQQGMAELLAALPMLRVTRITVVFSSQLTKLQLMRIAREKAPQGAIDFQERPLDG
jgi:hypothetical protein